MKRLFLARAALGQAALYAALTHSAAAAAATGRAQATAVIRGGVAIQSSGGQTSPQAPPDEHTVLTVVRPCDTLESHRLCAIVTIEMH